MKQEKNITHFVMQFDSIFKHYARKGQLFYSQMKYLLICLKRYVKTFYYNNIVSSYPVLLALCIQMYEVQIIWGTKKKIDINSNFYFTVKLVRRQKYTWL